MSHSLLHSRSRPTLFIDNTINTHCACHAFISMPYSLAPPPWPSCKLPLRPALTCHSHAAGFLNRTTIVCFTCMPPMDVLDAQHAHTERPCIMARSTAGLSWMSRNTSQSSRCLLANSDIARSIARNSCIQVVALTQAQPHPQPTAIPQAEAQLMSQLNWPPPAPTPRHRHHNILSLMHTSVP